MFLVCVLKASFSRSGDILCAVSALDTMSAVSAIKSWNVAKRARLEFETRTSEPIILRLK